MTPIELAEELLLFFNIAFDTILPIFLVMLFGFLVSKYFTLDLGSLSKLNFYVFIPGFMFYSLFMFKPSNQEVAETVLFNLLLSCLSFLAMYGVTRWLKFETNLAAAATLGVMIFNSANYGIPVVQAAFPKDSLTLHEGGIGIQVITITTMNVITYTLGILIAGGWSEWRKGVSTIIKLPILYALVAALILRSFDITPPDAVLTPFHWIYDGMTPIALLTLGAQLGKSGFSFHHPRQIVVTTAVRLLVCPLLAFLLIHAMGLHGLVARVLFVSSAFPTAAATVLLGIEYDKEPTFAADVVSITTLLSAVTVAGAISLSMSLF